MLANRPNGICATFYVRQAQRVFIDGEPKDDSISIEVECWNELKDIVLDRAKAGDMVLVTGKLAEFRTIAGSLPYRKTKIIAESINVFKKHPTSVQTDDHDQVHWLKLIGDKQF